MRRATSCSKSPLAQDTVKIRELPELVVARNSPQIRNVRRPFIKRSQNFISACQGANGYRSQRSKQAEIARLPNKQTENNTRYPGPASLGIPQSNDEQLRAGLLMPFHPSQRLCCFQVL